MSFGPTKYAIQQAAYHLGLMKTAQDEGKTEESDYNYGYYTAMCKIRAIVERYGEAEAVAQVDQWATTIPEEFASEQAEKGGYAALDTFLQRFQKEAAAPGTDEPI